jgi:hypothetical protein
MSEFVAGALERIGDSRVVVSDPEARYFGTQIDDQSLVPGPDAQLGETTYDAWVAANSH